MAISFIFLLIAFLSVFTGYGALIAGMQTHNRNLYVVSMGTFLFALVLFVALLIKQLS